MGEETADFLVALDRAGNESRLGRAEGTVRVELDRDGRTERWFLALRRGKVSVSRRRTPYDCTIHTSGALFDAMVSGRANAMTALLRGEVEVDGNPELLVLLQRLFPSPPSTQTRTGGADRGRRR
jgi:putative sterol carrier protein